MLQRVSLSLLFLYLYACATAQDSTRQQQDTIPKKHHTRYIAWTTPVNKPTTINGAALRLMAISWSSKDSLTIQGINVDVAPLQVFLMMLALGYGVMNPFSATKENVETGKRDVFQDSTAGSNTILKGLSLSAGGMAAELKGVGVNGVMAVGGRTDGVQVTGILNLYYNFRGVAIAGICNRITTGKGVQIGLVNIAKGGRIVQIGLFNRIGNRITPFFNCSLKKKPVPPLVATID